MFRCFCYFFVFGCLKITPILLGLRFPKSLVVRLWASVALVALSKEWTVLWWSRLFWFSLFKHRQLFINHQLMIVQIPTFQSIWCILRQLKMKNSEIDFHHNSQLSPIYFIYNSNLKKEQLKCLKSNQKETNEKKKKVISIMDGFH